MEGEGELLGGYVRIFTGKDLLKIGRKLLSDRANAVGDTGMKEVLWKVFRGLSGNQKSGLSHIESWLVATTPSMQ